MFAARIGTSSEGEKTVADPLPASVGLGMLILADRGLDSSYELFGEFAERGCDLVWRVKRSAVLSYTSGSQTARRAPSSPGEQAACPFRARRQVPGQRPGATTDRGEHVLPRDDDPRARGGPGHRARRPLRRALGVRDRARRAEDPPAWARIVLRAKTADGVLQEVWGTLCVHSAIRALMCRAAKRGTSTRTG